MCAITSIVQPLPNILYLCVLLMGLAQNGSIKQKDREELLRLINIMHRSLTSAGELFDLELSDLRNLQELQWKLFHALELSHNEDDKSRWSHQFILPSDRDWETSMHNINKS